MNSRLFPKLVLGVCFFLFFLPQTFAHAIIGELENMSSSETMFLYLKLGYQHILPSGLDHILFIVSLFLLSPKLKMILWQSAVFTIAHTVTLALAMYKVVAPPAAIVEPLISLSIMFVALQNFLVKNRNPGSLSLSRIAIVFLFGLIHGLGFAGSLSSMGLPQNSFLSSLLVFNVGVELGQLTIIFLAYFLLGKWLGEKPFYRKIVVVPASAIVFLIAAYWTVERTLLQ